jgi:hypothetical protein
MFCRRGPDAAPIHEHARRCAAAEFPSAENIRRNVRVGALELEPDTYCLPLRYPSTHVNPTVSMQGTSHCCTL